MSDQKCTCAFPCGGTDCGPKSQAAHIRSLEEQLESLQARYDSLVNANEKVQIKWLTAKTEIENIHLRADVDKGFANVLKALTEQLQRRNSKLQRALEDVRRIASYPPIDRAILDKVAEALGGENS